MKINNAKAESPDLSVAIVLKLLAAALMVGMSACVKVAAQAIELEQVIFWRSLLSLFPILIYMIVRHEFPRGIMTKHPMMHAKRSLLGFIAMLCSFISFKYLTMGQATALSFLVPIASLPLAAYFLGERITLKITISVVVGFVGVIIMLLPDLSSENINYHTLLGVGGGFGFVLMMSFLRVFIKNMVETETVTSIPFYFGVTGAALALLSAPFGWTMPRLEIWIYLLGAGVLGGAAHIAATEAIAKAPVSILGPFEYTGLLWAMLFDVILFGLLPDYISVIGALIIIVATLLVTQRNSK
ncbi:DMT family transporter [Amphibiibacter pelophylacis]|uniref:DMT family transporter n=1 Tax=Amphibiibacter pelophylacis TaxID=1799477 RepID=A0ACC6P2K4_9BURK